MESHVLNATFAGVLPGTDVPLTIAISALGTGRGMPPLTISALGMYIHERGAVLAVLPSLTYCECTFMREGAVLVTLLPTLLILSSTPTMESLPKLLSLMPPGTLAVESKKADATLLDHLLIIPSCTISVSNTSSTTLCS